MSLNRDVRVKYLGHGTFVFRTPGGKTLLIDPWIDGNPKCPEGAGQLDSLDTLLITHGHFDHVHDAVRLAKKFNPQVGCIFELGVWLEQQGIKNVSGMNKGGTQRLGDVDVTMVDARHSSGFVDDSGNIIYLGEPAGYVITFENGFRIYFAGDTAVFGDMKIIGELYSPEVAFLPIGDLYTMDPRQAAYACRLLGVGKVIPMHYGTFPPLTGTPEELRRLTSDLGTEIIAIEPGQEI